MTSFWSFSPLRARSTFLSLAVATALLASAASPAAATFRERTPVIPAGSLGGPYDVAVDEDGNVFVVENSSNRVRKYSASGQLLREWGSSGSAAGQFSFPQSIAVDSVGNVYVADTGNDRIQKFSGLGTHLLSFGTSGTEIGQFTSPVGVALDRLDRVYVADAEAYNVQKFTAAGVPVLKFATTGSDPSDISSPIALDVDDAGNVYIVDRDNDRIQKFSSIGYHSKTWGSSGTATGQFLDASGIAVDHEGGVLVSDMAWGAERVQRFSATGAHLGTFADDGESLDIPRGLDVTADGLVHVADAGPDRIARFKAVPPDTTVKGPGGLIRDATPTFKFTSSQTPATFQCRLTGSGKPFAKCTATYTTPPLDDGLQVLVVRAVDEHGLKDPSPAEHEFRLDATPPQTWFDSTPAAITTDSTPTFAFSASERGTFLCSLDGAAATACTSPRTTASLADGVHRFRVWARDRAGNLDPTPASHTFEVR